MDAPRTPDPAPFVAARFVATSTARHRRPALTLPIVRRMAAEALLENGGSSDDLVYHMLLAHDRLVALWVAHHGIEPALSYGEVIRVVTNDQAWNRVEVEGEIVGIDHAHGKYRVFSPDLGHARSGAGPRFRAIPYEDVRPAALEDGARAAA